MKYFLLFFLLVHSAEAANPLSFSGRIQDAGLAEDAIDLMHCLAEKGGTEWELGMDNSPAPRVILREQNGKLQGRYLQVEGGAEKSFSLGRSEWRRVCNEFYPENGASAVAAAAAAIPSLAPAIGTTASNDHILNLPNAPEAEMKKKIPWGWIGAGAAVLASSLVVWKVSQKRQPTMNGLTME